MRKARGHISLFGIIASLFLIVLMEPQAAVSGVCEELSPTGDNYLHFGIDYRPRIDFQPPDEGDEACPRELPEVLPATVGFDVYAYNLHGGLLGADFRIISDAPIQSFTAGPAVSKISESIQEIDSATWVDDIGLFSSGAEGPVLLGTVILLAAEGREAVSVDLTGFGGAETAVFTIEILGELPAVSPRHGAYAGASDLYHCQPPLCEEPHLPPPEFLALQSGGLVIELGWEAGDGNYTMIRCREDGIYPTSIYDGQKLVLMPTVPGQRYSITHSYPNTTRYWYTIFNLTKVAGVIVRGSQIETGSFVQATVDESVPAETTSWGSVKGLYR